MMLDGWAWWTVMAQIKQQTMPYPLMHSAWAETIAKLGGELQDVVMDRRKGEDRWSAKIRLIREGRPVSVDVRASDSLCLAVKCGVRIFVVEEALDRAADWGANEPRD